jgi:hypothetical protein
VGVLCATDHGGESMEFREIAMDMYLLNKFLEKVEEKEL